MKRGIQYFRKAGLVLVVAVMACLTVPCIKSPGCTDGLITVSAKGKSSKPRAVTVRNAKKGVKVTSGKYVFKITSASKKKRSVSVTGLSSKGKKLRKIVIPKNIKIKSTTGKNRGTHTWKVTSVGKNAFKGNKKVTRVTLGKNITVIGRNSFAKCKKLKKVILNKNSIRIRSGAFAGDTSLTQVVVPVGSKLEEIDENAFKGCTSLTDFNFDNALNLKKIGDHAFDYTRVDQDKLNEITARIKVESYTYEVIPMLEPFNNYFFIKTENPDPNSFRFADDSTVYASWNTNKLNGQDGGTLFPDLVEYADVKYENSSTKRVKGGYIGKGIYVDGGTLKLQFSYESNQGSRRRSIRRIYKDSKITVNLPVLEDYGDYIIDKYGNASKDYFDNLDGIQDGFLSECLYSGAYILGPIAKDTELPFYGISDSPHLDQSFYIQSPYYNNGNKSLLVSELYPMKCDSVAFPSTMAYVARKLNSSAVIQWDGYIHSRIWVTANGKKKSYGGAGEGEGKGINENQIKYWYSFDGTVGDAAQNVTLGAIKGMILEYGKLDVPEVPTDLPKLTWSSVRDTVGKNGSYVKIQVFGHESLDGFTFMYDDGSIGEGPLSWIPAIGYFSDAWYDGRYFDMREDFYPGITFEETLSGQYPDIVLKDVNIKIPDDGRDYCYGTRPIAEIDNYDPETGIWSGFTAYRYDSNTQTWKNSLISGYTGSAVKYRVEETENDWFGNYTYYDYKDVEDQDFIDACTITMDEAKSMNLDANTNKTPESYYIYDRTVPPGTYHSGG